MPYLVPAPWPTCCQPVTYLTVDGAVGDLATAGAEEAGVGAAVSARV